MESSSHTIQLDQLITKPNLRLGVISDTHNALNDGIVNALNGCDAIVHAGDIGDANVLSSLKKFSPHIFPVRGNNDAEHLWPEEDLPELANIPEHCELHFQRPMSTHHLVWSANASLVSPGCPSLSVLVI